MKFHSTNKNKKINKFSSKEIFNKFLTIEQLKKHPEIIPAIKGDKKVRLNILTGINPKVINIKGIQNQNKIKFASRLNSFNKLYFDFYKKNINIKDEIKMLIQENKEFSKKYNISYKNNIKEKFNDIKSEYEKRHYYISPIKENKNLFKGNILLQNQEELKNYILYDLGTPMSNSKSLSFLHKINGKLGDKTSERELKKINQKLDKISLGEDKIIKDHKCEIKKTKDNIAEIKETFNSINEMNYFFDSDTKNYLENLRTDNSRESSAKISTRVNSAINCLNNSKFSHKNSLNNLLGNKNKKIFKLKILNMINNINENKKKGSQIIIRNNKHNNENSLNNETNNNNFNYFKTIDSNDSNQSSFEKLYYKISTQENVLKFQPQLKKFLKKKKFDISLNINPISVCNNFESTREIINRSDFFKQNMQLRKQIKENNFNTDRINNKDMKIKDEINCIEDKMIKLFCDINNPRKKK